MPTAEDPLGWADIAADLERKRWYDQSDIDHGWPAGTSAANNNEPGLAGSPIVPPSTAAPAAPAAPAAITPVVTPPVNRVPEATGPGGTVYGGGDLAARAAMAAAAEADITQKRNSFGALRAMLDDAGLGDLYTTDASGNPGGWLWDRIVDGTADSETTLGIAIEQTDLWKTRYKVIVDLRAKAKAEPGTPVAIPSMAAVREYEKTVGDMLKRAGLPSTFYDQVSDLHDLMYKGLSPEAIQARLGTAWTRVRDSDPSVRAAYSEFYGIAAGDAALAATFLDPARMESNLERDSMAAYTAGMGRTRGLNIDKVLAERIALLPKSEAGIIADFDEVAGLEAIFTEGITETDNLTAEGTGLGAVALGEAGAKAALERRVLQRQANARSTVGGALSTNAGLTGVGES